jgi:GcrA cell cycle regulator
MPDFVWDEGNLLRLKVLWDEGLSGSRIGEILGISRCAVLGKIHRLNLPKRKSQLFPSETRVRRVRAFVRATKKLETVLVVAEPYAPSPGIGIMELESRHCHAIIGEGSDGLALYCGQQVAGRVSYCAHHASIFYNPVRRSA